MLDRFKCYADLSSEMNREHDYRIDYQFRHNSEFLIIAPHGGKIERGTTELACAIAADDLSFYSFLGLRVSRNSELHITSHKFDEPIALRLAAKSAKIVGVHGRRDKGDPETTYVGGLDDRLITSIEQQLRNGGFPTDSDNHGFPAKHPQNICNRGISGSGVQLELPKTLRGRLISSENALHDFSVAVRNALYSEWAKPVIAI